MWAVIIALKLSQEKWRGRKLVCHCDNESVVVVVNTGSTKDEIAQHMLREIEWITASSNTWLKMVHLPGKYNVLPDLLSRWYTSPAARQQFTRRVVNTDMIEVKVPEHLFMISHIW